MTKNRAMETSSYEIVYNTEDLKESCFSPQTDSPWLERKVSAVENMEDHLS